MLYLNKEVIWRVIMRYVKFWAMLVDLYIYLLTICIGFDLVLGVRKFTETFEIFGKSQLIVWFILILINDLMLGNRSIGKHMMEIEVVDEDGNIPSAWKLIVRSLILGLLFPIEILSTLVFNKTIGDFILKTEVIDEVKEHKKIKRGILSIFSSRKKKKVKNKNKPKGVIVETPEFLVMISKIGLILFGIILFMTTPLDEMMVYPYPLFVWLFGEMFVLFYYIYTIREKIYVRKDEIEVSHIFGKNKTYLYENITKIELRRLKSFPMITRYKICFNNNSKVYFETGLKNDKKLIEKLEENVSPEKFIYK